jgi:anti-sigma factor RsiW
MSRDWDTLLGAYVDGQLDPAEVKEVEQLIAANPCAREALRIHRETTGLLRAACAESFYTDFPDSLRRAIEKPWRGTPLRVSLAVAAALLLAGLGFLGGWFLASPAADSGALVDEVADYRRVFARATSHPVEVPASRSAEFLDRLGERIGRPLAAPDLSPAGWTFAGGRMLVVDGHPVAQLLYTRDGATPLAVCITRSRDANERTPVRRESRGGLDVASWQEDGYAYVVIGLPPDDRASDVVGRIAAALGRGPTLRTCSPERRPASAPPRPE